MRTRPGYALRRGVWGDVRGMSATHVTGTRMDDARPFRWRRDRCELFEFGSFNPRNANYQEGGRPWLPSAVLAGKPETRQ